MTIHFGYPVYLKPNLCTGILQRASFKRGVIVDEVDSRPYSGAQMFCVEFDVNPPLRCWLRRDELIWPVHHEHIEGNNQLSFMTWDKATLNKEM